MDPPAFTRSLSEDPELFKWMAVHGVGTSKNFPFGAVHASRTALGRTRTIGWRFFAEPN